MRETSRTWGLERLCQKCLVSGLYLVLVCTTCKHTVSHLRVYRLGWAMLGAHACSPSRVLLAVRCRCDREDRHRGLCNHKASIPGPAAASVPATQGYISCQQHSQGAFGRKWLGHTNLLIIHAWCVYTPYHCLWCLDAQVLPALSAVPDNMMDSSSVTPESSGQADKLQYAAGSDQQGMYLILGQIGSPGVPV